MTDHDTPPSKTLTITDDGSKSREQLLCDLAVQPFVSNASLTGDFHKCLAGERSLTELTAALKEQVSGMKSDMGKAEDILVSQSITLNAIFTELARRAALNMGEYLEATDKYMRLALKAQSQCRTTLETLSNIKNPPVVFAKQANIAHNQQVNQSVQTPSEHPTHAEKQQNQPNELLTENLPHDLDTRAQKKAVAANSKMETVGTVNRPNDS